MHNKKINTNKFNTNQKLNSNRILMEDLLRDQNSYKKDINNQLQNIDSNVELIGVSVYGSIISLLVLYCVYA
jgi:hypothetical protein